MKKLKTSLVLIALVITSGAVFATGNLKVNITPGERERAEVKVTNATQSQFEIEITNKYGDLVYYKQTKTPSTSYAKTFDFSALDDGQYTLTVKLDKESDTNTLDISNGKITVVDARKDLEPFFAFQNNELRVSYLNFEKENVTFYLYDNNTNKLVMEKDLNSDFAINYGLDFSKMERGNYAAVIAGTGRSYEYNIAID